MEVTMRDNVLKAILALYKDVLHTIPLTILPENRTISINNFILCAIYNPHLQNLCQLLRLKNQYYEYEETMSECTLNTIAGPTRLLMDYIVIEDYENSEIQGESEEVKYIKVAIIATLKKVLNAIPPIIWSNENLDRYILQFFIFSPFTTTLCKNLELAPSPIHMCDTLLLYREPLLYKFSELTPQQKFEFVFKTSVSHPVNMLEIAES